MDKLGNGGKGISWNTEHEVELLGRLNGIVTEDGETKGRPRIETDIDACRAAAPSRCRLPREGKGR
jgi:nitrate reductase alpha subunit